MSALPLRVLDAAAVRRWAVLARDALRDAREEIDGLNVYPVPDGDTGTNLHLTAVGAVEALDAVEPQAGCVTELGAICSTLAQGALLAARGNSGVITSSMLRGFADSVQAALVEEAEAGVVARALAAGAKEAYAAVATPVEGTMLTVARAAAEAAERAESAGGDLLAAVTAATEAAEEALARTPSQLAVLARAGVVDAGGRGICVILEALESVVSGAPLRVHPPSPDEARVAAALAGEQAAWDAGSGSGSYEVMYLLDAPATTIPGLRQRLGDLGDSLVVVGSEPTWNVHVHVDDVGAAVEAGVAAGRPHQIRVTNLVEAARTAVSDLPHDSRGVVSVVAGQGLAALFEASGATVVSGGPGRRASTAELLSGLRRAQARDLVVLPNDKDSLAVAEAAAAQAREEGHRVAVIPTRATVQALAALAVHDPTRRFEDDVVAMTAAARSCRHGGVTVAVRDAVTTAGVCRSGDILGIVDGDFALIGDDLVRVACTVADRMLGSGGELVTLVTGSAEHGGSERLAQAVVDHLRAHRPDVDAVVYDGGQPRYPLLIGVE
jgi:hypothetical protein